MEIEIERDAAKFVLAYPGLSTNQFTQGLGLSPKVAKKYLQRLRPLLIFKDSDADFQGRKGRKAHLAIHPAEGLNDYLKLIEDFLERRRQKLNLED